MGSAFSAEASRATALRVVVRDTAPEAGADAAIAMATVLREAVRRQGLARVLFASAPSQSPMIDALKAQDVPWARVTALHIDEYVGIDPSAPQAFGRWLQDHLFNDVRPGVVELMRPDADPAQECERYGRLVAAAPIDVACLGIGVNGHLAFNEPYQWTIDDPVRARLVQLDVESRRQQVDDGCFASLDEVPTCAITLTIPTLLAARHLVVTVSGSHKAQAVARCVSGAITPAVPASALQTHTSVRLFLDRAAAAHVESAQVGAPSAVQSGDTSP
ncbi:MAG TPA: 6-phosphogluconolactonase [Acidothermaceae bacterium]